MRLSNLKKQAVMAAIGMLLSVSLSCTVYAGQWKLGMDQNWYYYDDAGKKVTNGVTPDGYTVDEKGIWDESIPQTLKKNAVMISGQLHLTPDETCNNYAGKHAEPIFGVQTDKKQVSLTFDSDWENKETDKILDILDQYHLKCTFFLTGRWISNYPEDVKKIIAHGHEIGNHTTNHPELTKLTPQQITEQLEGPHRQLMDLAGIDVCLFRAPYGDYDNKVIDTAKSAGYYSIQWTIDSWDWMNRGSDDIINRVLNSKNLGNGAIVLMHNGAEGTPAALGAIIHGIIDKGYEIVPVSELIYSSNYHMNAAGTQIPD